jgi:hypothetical protein
VVALWLLHLQLLTQEPQAIRPERRVMSHCLGLAPAHLLEVDLLVLLGQLGVVLLADLDQQQYQLEVLCLDLLLEGLVNVH